MEKKTVFRRSERSQEQIAEEKKLRSRFQSERPSLESLVESGEYSAPMEQFEYFNVMQLAAELKRHRERLNLSLSDLEERSGIDKAALSRFENGLTENPTILTIERIARSIGKRLRFSLEDCAAG